MSEELSSYTLRVHGIKPHQRELVEDVLTKYAKTFKYHGLSRVDRMEGENYATVLRRKKLL